MNRDGFCPVEIEFTDIKAVERLALEFESDNTVLVIAERNCINNWHLNFAVGQMQQRCNLIWLDKVSPNPTQGDIKYALDRAGVNDLSAIIAIGGGSCIDLAKAVSAFHALFKNRLITVTEISKAITDKLYYRSEGYIDVIAIPSTAGTGSELTKWATIWDVNRDVKYSIDHNALYPKKAIIIPELTLTMPKQAILSTGLDALSHAIEAYWAKATNLLVKDIAIQAINRITDNLPKALENPNNLEYRINLCRGSVLAGMAFSQTRTTACHSISYPLTLQYNIPHGLAVALTLEQVANLNREHILYPNELFEIFEKYGGIGSFINMVCGETVNLRLSSFGVEWEQLPEIANRAFSKGRMDNNPVDLNKEQVIEILKSVF